MTISEDERQAEAQERKRLEELPHVIADNCHCSNRPSATIGAASAFSKSTGHMLVCGGATSGGFSGGVDLYSVQDRAWSHFEAEEKDLGAPDVMYCSVLLLDNMFMRFGGIGAGNVCDDRIWCFDFAASRWEEGRCTAAAAGEGDGRKMPSARYNSSFNIVPTTISTDSSSSSSSSSNAHRALLFGGRTSQEAILDDVWMLTKRKTEGLLFEWSQVSVSAEASHFAIEAPTKRVCARDGHCAAMLGGKLYVFGGTNDDGDVYNTTSVDVLTLKENMDSQMPVATWAEVPVLGEGPHYPVLGGIAESVEHGQNVVLLSSDSEGIFNTIFILHTSDDSRLQWTRTMIVWGGDWSMIPGTRLYGVGALDPYSGLFMVMGGHGGENDPKEGMEVIDVSDFVPDMPSAPHAAKETGAPAQWVKAGVVEEEEKAEEEEEEEEEEDFQKLGAFGSVGYQGGRRRGPAPLPTDIHGTKHPRTTEEFFTNVAAMHSGAKSDSGMMRHR